MSSVLPSSFSKPNARKLFIPDPGYLIADVDLAGADAQVVAWEGNDEALKAIFREGRNLHSENAKDLGIDRPLAKRWVHGTNYGGSAYAMALSCGIQVRKSEELQERWFSVHPGIKDWHRRIDRDLQTTRTVRNPFGYERYYFDRIEGLLPQALAWIPQSTVAVLTNLAWIALDKHPWAEPLLQVHDSLIFQFPSSRRSQLKEIRDLITRPIPYPDPLIIPWGLKLSTKSWGDCQKAEW